MARKQTSFLLWQKIAAGTVLAAFVGIFGYLYTMVLTEVPTGEFVEGEHYQVIENPRRIRRDKVEVMEFFSYGCVHCFDFDPDLGAWVEVNKDRVEFVRTPAVGSTVWRMFARAYYTMANLNTLDDNHARLFNDLHGMNRVLDTPEKLAKWIDGRGASEAAFLSVYNSAAVDRDLEAADQLARRLKVAFVPSIVINGKYLVQTTRGIGYPRMLEVMDYLIEKERTDALSSPDK